MPGFLRQSTAGQVRTLGPFLDSTTFAAATALTIANTDVKLVVNGAASANKNAGGGTHRINGVYGVTFDATDSATVGEVSVSVAMAGALMVFDKFFVIEPVVYDALFADTAPGYPLTAAPTVGAIRADLDANSTKLANLDAAVSSRLATAGYTTPDNITIAAISATIGIAGAGLTALGDVRLANLDAAVSTRLAAAGYTVPPTVALIRADLDLNSTKLANLDAAVSTRLAGAGYTAPPSAATIAGAVWDVVLAAHVTAGSTGAALSAAGGAGDPWITTLPGSYSAGQAGFLIGTYIDAAISTRLATAGYTAPPTVILIRAEMDANSAKLTAIDNKTTNLPSDPADQSLVIAAANAISALIGAGGSNLTGIGDVRMSNLDAPISSRLSTVGYTAPSIAPSAAAIRAEIDSNSTMLTLMGKLLRNKKKVDTATGIMTVYDDDGVSVLFTAPCFMDSSGTVPYDGTSGINNTGRLA